jgi:membrane protease YdiL (CAAX protease family)
MSIQPFAEAAQTIVPDPATPVATPPTTQPQSSPLLDACVLAWFVGAIVLAKALGVFRSRSIVGPRRLGERDSALWLIAALFAGYLFGSLAGGAVLGVFHVREDVKPLVLTVVVGGVGVPVILAALRLMNPNAIRSMGLSARRIIPGAAGAAAALLVIYPTVMVASEATMLLIKWMHLPEPHAHEVLQSLGTTHDRRLIALDLLTAVVIAPIFEELVFRGLIQTALSRMFGWLLGPRAAARWAAVIVTAAAFAAVHGQWAFVPPLMVLAIGLGYAYERWGNLWLTITTHALFNAVQIAVFLAVGTK